MPNETTSLMHHETPSLIYHETPSLMSDETPSLISGETPCLISGQTRVSFTPFLGSFLSTKTVVIFLITLMSSPTTPSRCATPPSGRRGAEIVLWVSTSQVTLLNRYSLVGMCQSGNVIK